MRYLIISFALFTSLNASMLLDKSYPICIEDFYVKGGKLYYLKSSSNTWGNTSSNYMVKNIYYGYVFNSSSGSCSPNNTYKQAISLGLDYFQFNFLMALTGLLFGLMLFYFIASVLVGI